jgi:hypothetical protein
MDELRKKLDANKFQKEGRMIWKCAYCADGDLPKLALFSWWHTDARLRPIICLNRHPDAKVPQSHLHADSSS